MSTEIKAFSSAPPKFSSLRNAKSDGEKNKKEENTEFYPYKIKQSKALGRYLVASRNLKAGEIVLDELPILVGPCQEAKPLCIGCYANIDLKSSNTYHRCDFCSWPLCSINCSGFHMKNGHSKEECNLLSKSLIQKKEILEFDKYYYALSPFRCLVIKESDPDLWEILKNMEAHTDSRKKSETLWKNNETQAVNVIRKLWGFEKFSESEIHFVCGILEVNAFEVTPLAAGNQFLQAIYPTAFLFCHDCTPNTNHSNGEGFQMVVHTISPIHANEKITVSYAYTLQPTFKRRKHLKETKFFSCTCKRCTDPTELGTFLNAIKCSSCKGYLLPENPLNDNSVWKCNSHKCKYERQANQVAELLEDLFAELDSISGNDIVGYEKFYAKCKILFHENHYLPVSALHCLSQLYGKINGYLINSLNDEQLERKAEICRKLLKIFEILEPGLSKQRGILLYELQASLMVMLKRKFQTQRISKKEMKLLIREILKYLEEAYLILSKEPENTTERQMAEAAKEGIKCLRDGQKKIN